MRAARGVRRRLATDQIDAAIAGVPRVPDLPDSASRGVHGVLARRGETCLVSSIVRQAWDGAHGRPRELVIGVTRPAGGFQAHAWLEGDPAPVRPMFAELTRRSPG